MKVILVLLLVIIILQLTQRRGVSRRGIPRIHIRNFHRRPIRRRQPEFRQPPLRNYKPKRFQQVGLLSAGAETLPLYGKESAAYNNRWNYYTTTQGDQIYSVPVTHKNRDCTEDIGCEELFDNQDVSVFGKDGTNYQTKLYRIDQHPYSLES
jgi:hypothetical protein